MCHDYIVARQLLVLKTVDLLVPSIAATYNEKCIYIFPVNLAFGKYGLNVSYLIML